MTLPHGAVLCVIAVFPDHTHLLFIRFVVTKNVISLSLLLHIFKPCSTYVSIEPNSVDPYQATVKPV